MKTRILSVLLVFLLLTSVSIPAVSAECAFPLIGAAPVVVPEIANVVICGVTVVMTGVAALKIAENFGKTWDRTREGWQRLTLDIGSCLSKAFFYGSWRDVTSEEVKALLNVHYDYYTATSGGGGKKDGPWYFKARKNIHTDKIEIFTERMDESQALEAMGRGKDIMTLNKELAQNLVGRFEGLSKEATKDLMLDFETHHGGAEGYFPHLHYYVKDPLLHCYKRLHCWSWK